MSLLRKRLYNGFLLMRYASLINLLIWFRSVALLNFFLGTVIIICAGKEDGNGVTMKITLKGGMKKVCPASNSEAIIVLLQSLSGLLNEFPVKGSVGTLRRPPDKLFGDISFVRNSQFFTSFAAAAAYYCTSIFGFHAITKTMFIFSLSF